MTLKMCRNLLGRINQIPSPVLVIPCDQWGFCDMEEQDEHSQGFAYVQK